MKALTAILLAAAFLLPTIPHTQAAVSSAPKPVVSFTFDDGFESFVTEAAPALASQGYSGTGYVTTGFVGQANYLTWDQVTALKNQYGWEIGSHSVTHPLMTTLSPTALNRELTQSKRAFQNHGITVNSFATPFGDYNPAVVAGIAKNYTSHRPFHDTGYNTWPYSDYLLRVQQVQGGVSVDTVKSYINEAKANNYWLILVFHDIKDNASTNPDDYEYNTADLEAIAAYVKSQNISVGNITDTLITGQPNLLANSTFDKGIADGWTTDAPNKVKKDTKNNGSLPSPRNSIQMTSNKNKNVHLFSPKVAVSASDQYVLKTYVNVKRNNGGELGFFIDEYDAAGNWISGQYQGEVGDTWAGIASIHYIPSSPDVASASMQYIASNTGNLNAYIDNAQWYNVN